MRSLKQKTESVHTDRAFASLLSAVVMVGICLFAHRSAFGALGEGAPVIQFFTQSFLPQSVTVVRGGSVTFERLQGNHRVRSGLPDGGVGTPDEPGLLFDFVLDELTPSFEYTLSPDRTEGIPFFDDRNENQIGFLDIDTGEETFRVGVVDNAFLPSVLYIFEGDSVRWEHEPNEAFHTVTSGLSSDPTHNPGLFFDEPSSGQLPIFVYRFRDRGEFPYFCRPHEFMGMTGVVFVEEIFLRGDATGSGDIDISDAISTLLHLFSGRPAIGCDDALDSNDDGQVTIADSMFTLGYLFEGGRGIPPPFPIRGADRTDDLLHCGL